MLAVTSSCKDQEEVTIRKDDSGIVISTPHIWKTSLSHDSELIESTIKLKPTYNKSVLFAARDEGRTSFAMLSAENGEVQWKWNDLLLEKEIIDTDILYQYENYLLAQDGSRFYQIDLSSGQTIQKEEKRYKAAAVRGKGSQYYISGNFVLNEEGVYQGAVFTGDIVEGNQRLLLTLPYSGEHIDGNNAIGHVNELCLLTDTITQDLLLAVVYADVAPEWLLDNYLGLYNLTKEEWIYDRIVISN